MTGIGTDAKSLVSILYVGHGLHASGGQPNNNIEILIEACFSGTKAMVLTRHVGVGVQTVSR